MDTQHRFSERLRRELRHPNRSWRVDETDCGEFVVPVGRRALRTIDGYEAMHLIRKGQIRWLPKGDVIGQRQFIHTLFGIAA
jgi:hypothetical protein